MIINNVTKKNFKEFIYFLNIVCNLDINKEEFLIALYDTYKSKALKYIIKRIIIDIRFDNSFETKFIDLSSIFSSYVNIFIINKVYNSKENYSILSQYLDLEIPKKHLLLELFRKFKILFYIISIILIILVLIFINNIFPTNLNNIYINSIINLTNLLSILFIIFSTIYILINFKINFSKNINLLSYDDKNRYLLFIYAISLSLFKYSKDIKFSKNPTEIFKSLRYIYKDKQHNTIENIINNRDNFNIYKISNKNHKILQSLFPKDFFKTFKIALKVNKIIDNPFESVFTRLISQYSIGGRDYIKYKIEFNKKLIYSLLNIYSGINLGVLISIFFLFSILIKLLK